MAATRYVDQGPVDESLHRNHSSVNRILVATVRRRNHFFLNGPAASSKKTLCECGIEPGPPLVPGARGRSRRLVKQNEEKLLGTLGILNRMDAQIDVLEPV